MKKTLKIIAQLDAWEKNQFIDFLNSPWANKRADMLPLFEILADGVAEPEIIWTQLYREKPFSLPEFRHLVSYLVKLLEKWMILVELVSDELAGKTKLIHAYRGKGLRDLAEKEWRKLEKGTTRLTPETAFQKGRLEYLLFTDRHQRDGESPLPAADHSLDAFYVSEKLKNAAELINRAHTLATRDEIRLLQPVLDLVAAGEFDEYPSVRVNFHIIQTLLHPENPDVYPAFLSVLKETEGYFPKSELGEFYAHAFNFCIRRLNEGQSAYLRQLFELYQLVLEKELLLDKGKFPPHHFKNIVTVGSRMQSFDWTEAFIHQNAPYLPGEQAENAKKYNLAYLNFAKGNFRAAMRLLREVEFDDVFYGLDARVLLMKAYYETDESEALFGLKDSFGVFLHRNKKISAVQRRIYKNFIRFVIKLEQLKAPSSRLSPAQLRAQLEKATHVADKQWLETKLKAFLNPL